MHHQLGYDIFLLSSCSRSLDVHGCLLDQAHAARTQRTHTSLVLSACTRCTLASPYLFPCCLSVLCVALALCCCCRCLLLCYVVWCCCWVPALHTLLLLYSLAPSFEFVRAYLCVCATVLLLLPRERVVRVHHRTQRAACD